MACTSCAKKKENSYQDFKSLESPPFKATDIFVYDINTNEYHRFVSEDWDTSKINVLLFVPNLAALNELEELSTTEPVNVTYVTNQPIHQIQDFLQANESQFKASRIFSSYLLPSRMNLMYNGFTKKAIAYIMKDGDVITQELFYANSFNYGFISGLINEYISNNN